MLPAPLHKPFHGEVGKQIEVYGGQGEARVFSAPPFLSLYLSQRGTPDPAKLLGHFVKSVREMLVLEFDDIDEHQQLIFGVVVNHGADGEGQEPQPVSGEGILKRSQDSSTKTAHAGTVILDQAGKERLFVR